MMKQYRQMNSDMIEELRHVVSICTSADTWICNKSFIGVTGHWITNDLHRKSVALAFRRMKGSHTYDKIAEMLYDIHQEYNLSYEKICFTVTDNGSNFVKAFSEYGGDDDIVSTVLECESGDDEGDVNEVEVGTILEDGLETDNDIHLPSHMKCASHTFNLVATKDVETALAASVGQYKNIFRSSMTKCTKLWNKVSRSTKAADLLEEQVRLSLRTPGATRQNSTFDAVKRLLHPSVKEKLPALMDGLKMPRFKLIELQILAEYIQIMSPVAMALDTVNYKEKKTVFLPH